MAVLELVAELVNWLTWWVVQPVLILLLGIFLGKVIGQVLRFALAEFLPEAPGLSLLSGVAAWTCYLVSLGYAFHVIGLLGVVSFVVGALVGLVLALHFLLTARDFASNVSAYSLASKRCPRGATIKTRYGAGRVVSVGLTQTQLKTEEGDTVYFPNRAWRRLAVERVSVKAIKQ